MVTLTITSDDRIQGQPDQEWPRVSDQRITHYTLLRAICDGLGLAPFGAAAHEAAIPGSVELSGAALVATAFSRR